MMGYTHVTSGLVTGIITLPIAPVHHWSTQVAWVITLGGAALLPDLDAPGSTAARMWGPPTRLLARAIFVFGKDGLVKHAEVVPEMTHHPDYDKALAAAK